MASPAFGTIGTQLQGTGSTMNVPAPSGVAVNDILRVTAFIDTTGVTVTAGPSGWAPKNSPVTGPDNHSLVVWWKRADAGDTGASTFDFTLSGSTYRNAACERYTGAITTGDPWDVVQTAGSNTSQTTTDDVATTTTSPDTLLCWSGTNWSGGTWTPPSGFTERRDTGDGVCTTADKAQAGAGSTGAIVGTCTGSDKRCAWVGALKSPSTAVADSSNYSVSLRLPGMIGPAGYVYLPVLFGNGPVSIDVTGTVAVTQANQTSSATGQLGYSGTVAVTQANQTSAATGQLGYTGTVARTQADQTSTASGTFTPPGAVSGTAAVTQTNQTSAASGQLGYSGTSARTQANQTSTAAGWITITGTVARTQTNQTSSATGVLGYTGTSARTQANQTSTATGFVPITGTSARTQANQTSTASGTISGVATPLPVFAFYSTRSFGADGYHVGENHTVFLPTRLLTSAPLVVVCHGTASEASFYYGHKDRYRPLEALAETGMVVVAGDLGEPSKPDGWGNDRSVAAVGEVITWARAQWSVRIDKVSLLGDSAGGATALNWARQHPTQVAGVALRAGVCDVDAIYTGGNSLLHDLIDMAYDGNWPAARPTHDPALNTGELIPIANRIRCYYSSGDGLVPPAATLAFANAVGCAAPPVGDMAHSDLIMTAIQSGDLAAWLWSLH